MKIFSYKQNEENVSPTKLCYKIYEKEVLQAKGKFYQMETQLYFIGKTQDLKICE